MAQPDDPTRRSFKSPKGGGEQEVTIEYLFQVDDLNSQQACTSPTVGKSQSPRQEEDQEPQVKKSVLARVREKARKLKNSLSLNKKHSNDDNDNAAPTASEASVDVGRLKEVEEEPEEEEEDAEYYGAPMYESEMAPKELKETARQHPREDVEISEKHILVGRGEAIAEGEKEEVVSKTISESVSEKLAAPAYAMAEATQMITSKIQDMAIATTKTLERKGSSAGEQIWDKGVSVKEYLMHKLEPGDDERALSQVISEAISPRSKGVNKAEGTASSNLENKEYSSTTSMSSTAASEPNTTSSKASNIPVSWNAYQEVEENHEGRILQAN
ncbi:hypothetical protein Sjap_013528 [Stephania japonica]|uniref:Uncharacterized protein n=1 Tax=Stephania japonica TaxID=461633 RepID=A0AAP0P1E1_9MAGN